MVPSAPSQYGSDLILAELVEEFTNRMQAGESVDVESYAQRHPEYAARIRQLLPALALLAEVGRSGSPDPDGALTGSREGTLAGTLGDFRILREVGRGGMGVVYEAEQISLRRRVALKVLPFAATMDPRHLQRFHNEAQAAACLHHTNIVPVFFVGCERGVHFYAMQFIDGQPLSHLIRQLRQADKKTPASACEEPTIGYQSPLGDAASTPRPAAEITPWTSEGKRNRDYFRKVAGLGVQAAEALDHAHQLGIVHRDIKPANLLLDGRGILWVTDFGLAHVRHGEANLTLSGQMVGTPRYMSPEQALAQRVPIDHRTDVYSLGATLYELLALRPVFAGEDRQELLQQIAFAEPAQLRGCNKAIPAELEIIVLKAMEKRPQDRYATAQELADDLRRFLLDQPIRARRPSLRARLGRWGRRHKPLVMGAMAALMVGLAVLAGSIGWVARDRQMRRAETERVVAAALEESTSRQEERRLPEALSAARANGLLAGADVDEALRQRVRVRLADLEMLDKLENVRLETMTAIKDGNFDYEGTDARYGQTFREAGLDVEVLPAEEVAERIRAFTVAVELAAVLDQWAATRRIIRGADDPSWKTFLRVARAADPDEWRSRMREALERRDRQALLAVAASENVFRLPIVTQTVLGFALRGDKRVHGQVEAFLRQAQRRHPDDFWLNYQLEFFFRTMQPPQPEEALRFAAVAVALRPASLGAHLNLGTALQEKGLLDEAIAECREAIRLKKDFAGAHNNLGNILVAKGQMDEAIAECREAIRLKKDFALPHYNLGDALKNKGLLDEAIAEYQEAIRLKKDFAGAHSNLGTALQEKGLLDEAIAEYRQAIRLEQDFADAHVGLGNTLRDKGLLDEAIAECREAIRLKKDFAEAHSNLGNALCEKGLLDEAIAEYREAIRLKKDFAEAHYNLGTALQDKGQLDEAIAECREAIRLKKDFAEAHCCLGYTLVAKRQMDEAIAECREAIRLKKDFALAHCNLGYALLNKGLLDESIAEYREAIRLKKNFAEAHCDLGWALINKGLLDESIAECREAIRLKKNFALAHCNLGAALERKGQFVEALVYRRRGHELSSKNPGWRYPSAQWMRNCERFVELDDKLPAILNGQKQPADTAERLGLAQLCQKPCKKRYAAAERLYSEAFAAELKLAEDLTKLHRYNAACAAALAGCGQGKDADKLDSKERARLHKQAQDWLHADLRAWQKILQKQPEKARPVVTGQMRHWLQDTDFASVRGAQAIDKLPEAERSAWRKLWEEVEELRQQAAPKKAGPSVPEKILP